jgi:uncharacterized lipoprotein
MTKTLTLLTLILTFAFLSGCGSIARQLDSTWEDNQTFYQKSESLPPLEVSPDFTSKRTTSEQG